MHWESKFVGLTVVPADLVPCAVCTQGFKPVLLKSPEDFVLNDYANICFLFIFLFIFDQETCIKKSMNTEFC